MLEVKNISYERDDNIIMHGLSFLLQPSSFLYIAGENGKGKTTLLKLLAGILYPTSGCIFWNQHSILQDPEIFYRNVNYIGHKSAVNYSLTPTENLYFSSRAYSLKSTIKEALATVDLCQDSPASFLSAGQVRRIALARLLLLDTPLWLLDEPYTALDTKGVAWLQKQIHVHLDQGGIIIMTSHQEHGITTKNIQEIYL